MPPPKSEHTGSDQAAGGVQHVISMTIRRRDGRQVEIAGVSSGETITDIVCDAVDTDGLGLDAVVLGRVVGHDPKRRNLRVEIGASQPAFLAQGTDRAPDAEKGNGIAADTGLFQIKGLPRDGKGFTVARDIGLTGRFVVLTPFDSAIRGGRNWPDPRRQTVAALVREGGGPGGQSLGWILRTAAVTADDAAIADEVRRLSSVWQDCKNSSRSADTLPKVLAPATRPAERLLLDHPGCSKVLCPTGDAALFLAGQLRPRLPDVNVVADNRASDLVEAAAMLLGPEIALPSGGRIIMEQTQACVTVDVDQGSCPTPAQVNREAVDAVARHLRLRNLAGTIVIDFLTDRSRKPLTGIRSRLESALAGDPRRIHALDGPSPLGLIQFARERRGMPLSAILSPDDI
ncbi:ribonuclease E/G [Fodinicurvata sp. EGI_FJ10296]|uniref:ribonuclease E/G n=1 Tax=Fodinicurvata sp. EGI_FJ10296 TaxID=3231908 RepID=UPI0034566164